MNILEHADGMRAPGLIRAGNRAGLVRMALETPELDLEDAVGVDVPWNVVVHNDPVNLMSYVTKVFQKVLGFNRERAEKHMLEVHRNGRSVVWTGEKEKAEFYVQQLQAHLLLTTLEKSV